MGLTQCGEQGTGSSTVYRATGAGRGSTSVGGSHGAGSGGAAGGRGVRFPAQHQSLTHTHAHTRTRKPKRVTDSRTDRDGQTRPPAQGCGEGGLSRPPSLPLLHGEQQAGLVLRDVGTPESGPLLGSGMRVGGALAVQPPPSRGFPAGYNCHCCTQLLRAPSPVGSIWDVGGREVPRGVGGRCPLTSCPRWRRSPVHCGATAQRLPPAGPPSRPRPHQPSGALFWG